MDSITTNTALVTKAQLYNHYNSYRINTTTKFMKNFLWCSHSYINTIHELQGTHIRTSTRYTIFNVLTLTEYMSYRVHTLTRYTSFRVLTPT